MAKLDPTVRRETGYIAAWVLALSLILQAAFLLAGKWNISVLLGNVIGGLAAVGNYLLLGITVAKAAAGPKERVALRVRSSMTARLLGQAAVAALAVGVLHTNVYATILPLLFPRVGIAFRPMVDKRRGNAGKTGNTGMESKAESDEGRDLLE